MQCPICRETLIPSHGLTVAGGKPAHVYCYHFGAPTAKDKERWRQEALAQEERMRELSKLSREAKKSVKNESLTDEDLQVMQRTKERREVKAKRDYLDPQIEEFMREHDRKRQ